MYNQAVTLFQVTLWEYALDKVDINADHMEHPFCCSGRWIETGSRAGRGFWGWWGLPGEEAVTP